MSRCDKASFNKNSELSFGLVCNGLLLGLKFCLINQIVVLDRLHVCVKLKDKWARRRYVVSNNFFFVHAGKLFHNGA